MALVIIFESGGIIIFILWRYSKSRDFLAMEIMEKEVLIEIMMFFSLNFIC